MSVNNLSRQSMHYMEYLSLAFHLWNWTPPRRCYDNGERSARIPSCLPSGSRATCNTSSVVHPNPERPLSLSCSCAWNHYFRNTTSASAKFYKLIGVQLQHRQIRTLPFINKDDPPVKLQEENRMKNIFVTQFEETRYVTINFCNLMHDNYSPSVHLQLC